MATNTILYWSKGYQAAVSLVQETVCMGHQRGILTLAAELLCFAFVLDRRNPAT